MKKVDAELVYRIKESDSRGKKNLTKKLIGEGRRCEKVKTILSVTPSIKNLI